MIPREPLPRLPGLDLRPLDATADGITAHAEVTAPAACPHCLVASAQVHRRYARTLTDKPLARTPLRRRVTVRRFARVNPACPRAIFAEPLGGLAPAHARTTADPAAAHTAIGLAAGGEPGSRSPTPRTCPPVPIPRSGGSGPWHSIPARRPGTSGSMTGRSARGSTTARW